MLEPMSGDTAAASRERGSWKRQRQMLEPMSGDTAAASGEQERGTRCCIRRAILLEPATPGATSLQRGIGAHQESWEPARLGPAPNFAASSQRFCWNRQRREPQRGGGRVKDAGTSTLFCCIQPAILLEPERILTGVRRRTKKLVVGAPTQQKLQRRPRKLQPATRKLQRKRRRSSSPGTAHLSCNQRPRKRQLAKGDNERLLVLR